MEIKFSEQFQDLINFDVPRKMFSSVENNNFKKDIKYAEDGFIAKYCMDD